MQVPRPTDDDLARFRALVPDDPRIDIRPMFGQLAAFVNGNMFLGLVGSAIGAKVGPAEADRLADTVDGVTAFAPAGRVMRGWVTIPAAVLGTPAAEAWVRAAIDHVATLPPKARR